MGVGPLGRSARVGVVYRALLGVACGDGLAVIVDCMLTLTLSGRTGGCLMGGDGLKEGVEGGTAAGESRFSGGTESGRGRVGVLVESPLNSAM